MVDQLEICIVGMGLRGLGVFERLIAHFQAHPPAMPLMLHLVDGRVVPEQYDTEQPDYLLLNIVCSQVSLFPASASVGKCSPLDGPNFYEWVKERGLKIADDGYSVGSKGREIRPDDFLPRRLLGEYAKWFRDLLLDHSRALFSVAEHRAAAISVVPRGDRFVVSLANGNQIETDRLFLTVGQAQPLQPKADVENERWIPCPYPLPRQLDQVQPGQTVAIVGLGLSFVDIVLSLTVGRGGIFEKRDGLLEYARSGSEPVLIAYSRSGLPFRSRPGIGRFEYEPVIFHPRRIDQIKASGGIDFDDDVLPLLLTEIRIAYWNAYLCRERGEASAKHFVDELRNFPTDESVIRRLDELDSSIGKFDPRIAYFWDFGAEETETLRNSQSYQSWFVRRLTEDLLQAQLGVAASPLKAALEMCRECRDTIRRATEFDSMEEASREFFFSRHADNLNRIVIGPQKERTAELIALVRAGVLQVPLGPAPRAWWSSSQCAWQLTSTALDRPHQLSADWLVVGMANCAGEIRDGEPLIQQLLTAGVLRYFRPFSETPHAIEIDRNHHPIGTSGHPNPNMWVLGLLTEGVTFYNSHVPANGRFDRSIWDADQAVSDALQMQAS